MHQGVRRWSALGLVALPLACFAQSPALFADKGCVSCHGDKGQGVPGLAPSLQKNAFVASASEQEVADTIRKGRLGKNRRHTNIPGGMPPNSVTDEEAQALVKYLKGDMQK
jgi:mono/diheme cytochrome c family protein